MTLGRADFAALCAAIPLAAAVGERKEGVQVRLDATDGLTRTLVALHSTAAATVPVSVALSCFAAGDLTITKEGVARVDSRLLPLVATLGSSGPMALLSEWGDAFLATGRRPTRVYREIADQLAQAGVVIAGTVAAIDEDPATEFSLLVERLGMWGRMPEWMFEAFGLFAPELSRPIEGADQALHSLDLLRDVRFLADRRLTPAYSRRLARSIGLRHPLARRYDANHMLISSPEGWRLSPPEGTGSFAGEEWQLVSKQGAIDLIGARGREYSIAVVCQPRHFHAEPPGSRSPGALLGLPAPFERYLSICSDIDWSTRTKTLAYRRLVGEELGLPLSDSFFLRSSMRGWVGAYDRAGAPISMDADSEFSLEAQAARGEIDTFHHLTFSIFQARLSQTGSGWRPGEPTPLSWGKGFLVVADRHCSRIDLIAEGREHVQLNASLAPDVADGLGRHQSYFPLDNDWAATLGNADWRVAQPADLNLREVILIDIDPLAAAAQIERLASRGVRPAVQVAHGGNTRNLANLRNEQMATREPGSAAFDMDDPGSVFHLSTALFAMGVRFVAPIGMAYRRDLVDGRGLLSKFRLRDGSWAWAFGRVRGRDRDTLGFSDEWSHGKTVAHAAALAYQLSDILQRMAWTADGEGGLLYTHLGHTQFDQASDRLIWPAENYGALERLAAAFHPDGESRNANAVWVAPASCVLMHQAINIGLQDSYRYEKGCVEIESWGDEALHLSADDVAVLGDSLLHGQSFVVDDAETARLRLNGRELRCLSRTSAAGRPATVTIIDDTAPSPLLLSLNRLAADQDGGRVEFSADLRDWRDDVVLFHPDAPTGRVRIEINPRKLLLQEAWTIETRGEPRGLQMVVEDDRGELYTAGSAEGDSWRMLHSTSPDAQGWRRHVFRFSDRRSHPAGRPRGHVRAVLVRWALSETPNPFEVRAPALLRPRASALPPPPGHWLGGRVADMSGRPIAGVTVEACCGATVRGVATDLTGRFELDDLPRHWTYLVRGTAPGRLVSPSRGRAFASTQDDWDWDFVASAPTV